MRVYLIGFFLLASGYVAHVNSYTQKELKPVGDINNILEEIGMDHGRKKGLLTMDINNILEEMRMDHGRRKGLPAMDAKNILEAMRIADGRRKEWRAKDCSDLRRQGHVTSGVYEIYPDTLWRPLSVYCDMTTDGGGWTVFQRRRDGSEEFNRTWNEYRFGFGNLSAEFWLGNEFLYRIMQQAPQEMRIELEDFENDRRFAKYALFGIDSADNLYRLHVEDFSGNVTDSLIGSHNNMQFSTRDRGPSIHCSRSYEGGFWYNDCHSVNINGLYLKGKHKSYADGVEWYGFRGYYYSLKFTEMKFRSK